MNVGIIGVGLLGGSIGYILKEKSWANKVLGIGRDEEKLKQAVELKCIDEYSLGVGKELNDIDILILAVPVRLISKFVIDAIPFLKDGAIITDVGSTKKDIVEEIEGILPSKFNFIGGHPMAGSEKTGANNFDPYLFDNAVYVLTRSKKTNNNALSKIKEMVAVLGSRVLEMGVDEHDLAVATISHLPHVLAAALVNSAEFLDSKTKMILPLAAGGFRDTTRIASGSPPMWRDICLTNSEKIIETITQLEKELGVFKEAIKNKDEKKIEKLFTRAKDIKDSLPKRKKGMISPLINLLVVIENTPGSIGLISKLLGENKVNIKDIEVLHTREQEEGNIRLGIETEEEANIAIKVLNKNGLKSKILE